MPIPGTEGKNGPGNLCESLSPVMVGYEAGHTLHAI